jgi:predicted dehydrogenase
VAGGALGDIRAITGVGLWRRLDEYYSRTGWAGKLAVNGNYVLDGTVCNPLSHLLNNMLLLARSATNGGCACVSKVTAELYHAHDIEGEDTSCLRVEMGNGVLIHFYATLCHEGNETPYIEVEGACGKARWDFEGNLRLEAAGEAAESMRRAAGPPGYEGCNPLIVNMARNLIDVAEGREDKLYCSVQDTFGFTKAMNGAFLSSGGTRGIPDRFVRRYPDGGSVATDLAGIKDLILRAAEQRKLFSEMGVEWAVPGSETSMKDFNSFSMRFQHP